MLTADQTQQYNKVLPANHNNYNQFGSLPLTQYETYHSDNYNQAPRQRTHSENYDVIESPAQSPHANYEYSVRHVTPSRYTRMTSPISTHHEYDSFRE